MTKGLIDDLAELMEALDSKGAVVVDGVTIGRRRCRHGESTRSITAARSSGDLLRSELYPLPDSTDNL